MVLGTLELALGCLGILGELGEQVTEQKMGFPCVWRKLADTLKRDNRFANIAGLESQLPISHVEHRLVGACLSRALQVPLCGFCPVEQDESQSTEDECLRMTWFLMKHTASMRDGLVEPGLVTAVKASLGDARLGIRKTKVCVGLAFLELLLETAQIPV
jgi:hypothetical protein